MKKSRLGRTRRKTRETEISVDLDLDGSGRYAVETGLPFLNHMLELFAKHSLVDLKVSARGDLDVDAHHTVEDVGLSIGRALNEALGDRKGIARYGSCCVPMDDSLSRAAVDIGGRPYLVCDVANRKKKIKDFDLDLVPEFLRALVVESRINLHVAQLYGKDAHHAYESMFKAIARAFRSACARDQRVRGAPSSKGVI